MILESTAWLAALNSPFAGPAILIVTAIAAALAETFFPAHHSEREDNRRIFANFSLALVNALIALALPVSTLAALSIAETSGFGLLHFLAAPLWITVPATLLGASLINYGAHVTLHRIPLLWRIHKIHHCDRAVDFSTAFRHHPCEPLLMLGLTLPIMVIMGLHAQMFLMYALIESAFAMLSHVNTRLPENVSKRFEWLMVTPNLHALHHSPRQQETDSNFGSLFSCWDRLFGTLRSECSVAPEVQPFGLDDVSAEQSRQIVSLLLLPLQPATPPQVLPKRGPGN